MNSFIISKELIPTDQTIKDGINEIKKLIKRNKIQQIEIEHLRKQLHEAKSRNRFFCTIL